MRHEKAFSNWHKPNGSTVPKTTQKKTMIKEGKLWNAGKLSREIPAKVEETVKGKAEEPTREMDQCRMSGSLMVIWERAYVPHCNCDLDSKNLKWMEAAKGIDMIQLRSFSRNQR